MVQMLNHTSTLKVGAWELVETGPKEYGLVQVARLPISSLTPEVTQNIVSGVAATADAAEDRLTHQDKF